MATSGGRRPEEKQPLPAGGGRGRGLIERLKNLNLTPPGRGRGRGWLLEQMKQNVTPPGRGRGRGWLLEQMKQNVTPPGRGRGRGWLLEQMKQNVTPPVNSARGHNQSTTEVNQTITETRQTPQPSPTPTPTPTPASTPTPTPTPPATSNACDSTRKPATPWVLNNASAKPLVQEVKQLKQELTPSTAQKTVLVPLPETDSSVVTSGVVTPRRENNITPPPASSIPRVKANTPKLPDDLTWILDLDRISVDTDYLSRLEKEPVGDTPSLVEMFTPGLALIHRCNISLALARLHIVEQDLNTALNVLQGVVLEDFQANHIIEDELANAFGYVIVGLKEYILSLHGKHEPLVVKSPPPQWAMTYVKAANTQLFGIGACRRALTFLLDLKNEKPDSLQIVELLFLRARILGKLRYLEQWPANKWNEEETLLGSIISQESLDPRWMIRTKVYLAEYLRLRGYREFMETKVNIQEWLINKSVSRYYTEAEKTLKSLQNSDHMESGERLVWLAEQFVLLPTYGDENYLDIIADILRRRADPLCGELVAYNYRVRAKYLELKFITYQRLDMANDQRLGIPVTKTKMDDQLRNAIISSLDVAIDLGSTKAQLEKVAFLYRMDPKTNMMPLLKGLPDSQLHIAAYLILDRNKPDEAMDCLNPYLCQMPEYPPLKAHYPVCFHLCEPINLPKAVEVHHSGPGERGPGYYLAQRQEIIEESNRLKANKATRTFKRPSRFAHKRGRSSNR